MVKASELQEAFEDMLKTRGRAGNELAVLRFHRESTVASSPVSEWLKGAGVEVSGVYLLCLPAPLIAARLCLNSLLALRSESAQLPLTATSSATNGCIKLLAPRYLGT